MAINHARDLTDVIKGLGDRVKALEGAAVGPQWIPYTPAWTSAGTNPTPSASTVLRGRYVKTGRTVTVAIYLVPGTGTIFGTGAWRFSLPFTATASPVNHLGTWYTPGAGGTAAAGTTVLDSGSYLRLVTVTGASVDSATPATWIVGNSLNIQITYETDL